MDTGRTSPALCGCVDEFDNSAGDYVVKLRGAVDAREAGLVNELFASQLATYFGLARPGPALIMICQEFADAVALGHPAKGSVLRQSVGINFGTKHLIGVSTWPVDKAIPEERFVDAAEIFAFDALVQNPDRMFDNPNLFTRGDGLFVFDHEAAFSFLLAIPTGSLPWEADRQLYLEKHVFFRRLKSKPLELEGFIENLKNLSDGALAELVAEVPSEWDNRESLNRIVEHLRTVRSHATEFADAIRRVLR